MTEADRARTQGTPLSLTILQIDRGAELLRQQGESPMEKFLERFPVAAAIVRQNECGEVHKSWSLAFICRTRLWRALRIWRTNCGARQRDCVRVGCDGGNVERRNCGSVARPDFDSEDIVTDLINRAEFSLEEARKRGDTMVRWRARGFERVVSPQFSVVRQNNNFDGRLNRFKCEEKRGKTCFRRMW